MTPKCNLKTAKSARISSAETFNASLQLLGSGSGAQEVTWENKSARAGSEGKNNLLLRNYNDYRDVFIAINHGFKKSFCTDKNREYVILKKQENIYLFCNLWFSTMKVTLLLPKFT